MGLYQYDSGQYIFDRVLVGFWIVIKWLFKAAIYFPLWFTGYIITTKILDTTDSAFAWVGLILIFALALYQLVFFLKGMLIGFLNEGNLCWIPLFMVCVVFTSLLPAWIAFDSIQTVAYQLSEKSGNILAWIGVSAFAIFLYSRYHFLTNIAPVAAFPAYQFGINTALTLLRIDPDLVGEESNQMI